LREGRRHHQAGVEAERGRQAGRHDEVATRHIEHDPSPFGHPSTRAAAVVPTLRDETKTRSAGGLFRRFSRLREVAIYDGWMTRADDKRITRIMAPGAGLEPAGLAAPD